MTDIVSGFLRAVEGFFNTRLGNLTEDAWRDSKSLVGSVTTFSSDTIKARYQALKADIDAMGPIGEAISKKIESQTKLIKTMVEESKADIEGDDFHIDQAARVAARIGMALSAADEAYRLIAIELARGTNGVVDEGLRDELMALWEPWARPVKDFGAGSSNVMNKFGRLLRVDNLVKSLSENVRLDREGGGFKLAAHLAGLGPIGLGRVGSGASAGAPFNMDGIALEAFLQFSDREFPNPTEAQKATLIQRGDKWFISDKAIIGLRLRSKLRPGLTSDPLLAKVMPGSAEPTTTTVTTIALDTAQGLYLGDGFGNERAVLPVRFSFPGVELREVAFGILRNPQRELTGFELTTSVAAKLGDAVGLQVVGAGTVIDLNGVQDIHTMFDALPVTPRWADAIGLRIKAGPITGGGFIQRVERTYKVEGQEVKRVEFGGALQLQILKFGVTAIVILSPDPFSLVLVMGVRFPVAIELSFGFTLNGIGGILALDRGLDLQELKSGLKDHILDKMLFPDDPISEAPKLLDKVAHVFPPRTGGFVVGPIVELGWGSQAKFVKMKVGVVLALPDPAIVILGSLRVQVPHEKAPITDIRADLFVAITPDYLMLSASMRDSKIAGFSIKGDLGLFIQWTGGGAFEFSVGGFHPEYEKLTGSKPRLGEMERITLDLSPGGSKGPIKLIIKAYFAITAGSVQLGVDGRLSADFKIIAARAWVTLDMIFIWSPRFAFKVSLEVGVEVDLFGFTIASVMLRGSLEGTRPFKLAGHIKVDVWFLPTFDKEVGPITWGEEAAPAVAKVDVLQIAASALAERDAWQATLPGHAAQLVTLAEVDDVAGLLAHPMAGLKVSQTQVPLGVKIQHVGAAPVSADMVMLGMPEASTGEAAAISELRTPFAPGHYFALEGEALLARSGFEMMQGGCSIAAATTPVAGPAEAADVAYRTWVRSETDEFDGLFAKLTATHVAKTVVGRANSAAGNPYLGRPGRKAGGSGPGLAERGVTVLAPGTSVLADAATGARVLPGLGPLGATEAALIRSAVKAAGLADTTRIVLQGQPS